MCKTEIKTMNFWSLLNTHFIEIPKIQRDYAQGRDSVKTELIRTNILEAFYKAIENDKKLNLDFVYGTVKEDNKLIPLDGQQRLTTLFLLHWYLYSISKNLSEETEETKETKEIFLKFTYETRLSSRRFCEALINNNISIDNSKKLSSQIMDNSWFYFTWKKDPTIKAMLTMLDAIDAKFKGKTEFWEKLKTTNLIEFEFLPLDKFNLTEELYVKMNARGKSLSDFENFKSWLDEKLEEKTTETFKKEWSLKLDTVWTDLFWRNDNEDFSIDEEMMSFFRGMTMFNYIEKFKETNDTKKDFEKKIGELNSTKDYYISNEEFENILFKDDNNPIFSEINCFLDFYSKNETTVLNLLKKVNFWKDGEDNLFLKFIQEPNFSQRVLFFGLYKYILKNSANLEKKELEVTRFFRVLRNLVNNSDVNASSIKNILISINKLVETEDILTQISNENTTLQGFNGSQTTEEQLKATLILQNPELDWENEIIEVENHSLFKGSINFILPEKKDTLLDKFILRKNVSMILFKENGVSIDKESNLLGRSMLVFGLGLIDDYEIWLGGKWNQYWKKDLQDKNKYPYILNTIDLLLNQESDKFIEIIESNIQKFVEEENNIPKWKLTLLKNPCLFKSYTCYGRVKKDWRGINLYEQQKFNTNANAILIENNRNEVITYFIEKLEFKLKHQNINKCGKFYAGDDIILLKEGITLIFKKEILKAKIKDLDFEKEYDFTKGVEYFLPDLENNLKLLDYTTK